MKPEIYTRIDALPPATAQALEVILGLLVTAGENDGLAILAVDEMANGQASVLTMGDTQALIPLMIANAEVYKSLYLRPEEVPLQ